MSHTHSWWQSLCKLLPSDHKLPGQHLHERDFAEFSFTSVPEKSQFCTRLHFSMYPFGSHGCAFAPAIRLMMLPLLEIASQSNSPCRAQGVQCHHILKWILKRKTNIWDPLFQTRGKTLPRGLWFTHSDKKQSHSPCSVRSSSVLCLISEHPEKKTSRTRVMFVGSIAPSLWSTSVPLFPAYPLTFASNKLLGPLLDFAESKCLWDHCC